MPGSVPFWKMHAEFSAGCVLDAVHWPQHLLQAIQVDDIVGPQARMVGCKTAVVGWVPILGHHHKVKQGLQLIHNRDDRFTVGHFEGTVLQKVILNVHQDDRSHNAVVLIRA